MAKKAAPKGTKKDGKAPTKGKSAPAPAAPAPAAAKGSGKAPKVPAAAAPAEKRRGPAPSPDVVLKVGVGAKGVSEKTVPGMVLAVVSKAGGSLLRSKIVDKALASVVPPRKGGLTAVYIQSYISYLLRIKALVEA